MQSTALNNLNQAKAQIETAIEVSGLSKIFRKPAPGHKPWKPKYLDAHVVQDVSFRVQRGEIYGVLGPNGSGKSTLIRAISTLLLPDAGTAKIFGLDIRKDEAKIRRLLNRVSVDAAFYKKLSPRENLLYSARLYGLDPIESERRSLEILARLGLKSSVFYEPLEEMSRGMQQKIAIARAFLTAPIVLLLDEPTTGLDPKSRRGVQEFILELRANHDATIILTTHDMPEAERLCDRIAFIHNGRFVAEGTATELKAMVGPDTNLEDAFIQLTGSEFDDNQEDQ